MDPVPPPPTISSVVSYSVAFLLSSPLSFQIVCLYTHYFLFIFGLLPLLRKIKGGSVGHVALCVSDRALLSMRLCAHLREVFFLVSSSPSHLSSFPSAFSSDLVRGPQFRHYRHEWAVHLLQVERLEWLIRSGWAGAWLHQPCVSKELSPAAGLLPRET
jgi:hypothetical protein